MKNNSIGCSSILGTGLLLCVMIVVAWFFNVWYFQQVYEIGFVPVLTQFSIFLPDLGFWVFGLIWTLIIATKNCFKTYKSLEDNVDKYEIHTEEIDMLNGNNVKDYNVSLKKLKETYNINDTDSLMSIIGKFTGNLFGMILTKLLTLLLLYITYCICFS